MDSMAHIQGLNFLTGCLFYQVFVIVVIGLKGVNYLVEFNKHADECSLVYCHWKKNIGPITF